MNNNTLVLEKLHKHVNVPTRGSLDSAGYDLYSRTYEHLRPGERKLFKLGFKTDMPPGIYGRIADRSGLAVRNGVTVLGGVIDSDYRGEWGVILLNTGCEGVDLAAGTRIAQVIFTPYVSLPIMSGILQDSERGEGGFGSTGL